MTVIASIVEGDGEVAALPILLRRVGAWRSPDKSFNVLPPIRVRRDRFLNREDEFRRMLLLAATKCGESGWILVLLDADDDCPAELGAQVLERARGIVPHSRVSVVLANREYEARQASDRFVRRELVVRQKSNGSNVPRLEVLRVSFSSPNLL